MKEIVYVVGAIIENENKEILCALRSTKMVLPNVWEFPGGKIEDGESVQEAIEREIEEELSCKISTSDEIFDEFKHEYENIIVNLTTIKCKIISGTPFPHEHDAILWLKRENMDSLIWAPCDSSTLNKLMKEI